MSTALLPSSGGRQSFVEKVTWHRPLLLVAIAMGVFAMVSAIGLLVDPRIVMGAPGWVKPLKFSISFGLYTLTLAWLIGMLRSCKRVAWWAGTIAGLFLIIEIMIITGAVVAGGTSHFNFTAPLNAALYQLMGVSIVIAWTAALPVIIVLFRTNLGDAARTVAIRAGFVVGLIGMGLAVLMTLPTPDQIANYQGLVGAHSVGVPDGGPGVPLLGWSTVGGDLRVPHFVGMHALQLIPLAAIILEILAARLPALRNALVRRKVIWIVVVLFVGTLAVLTFQALSGESIVRPSGIVVAATALLSVGAASAIALVLRRQGLPAAHPAPARRVDA